MATQLGEKLARLAEIDETNAAYYRDTAHPEYGLALQKAAERRDAQVEHHRKYGLPWRGM